MKCHLTCDDLGCFVGCRLGKMLHIVSPSRPPRIGRSRAKVPWQDEWCTDFIEVPQVADEILCEFRHRRPCHRAISSPVMTLRQIESTPEDTETVSISQTVSISLIEQINYKVVVLMISLRNTDRAAMSPIYSSHFRRSPLFGRLRVRLSLWIALLIEISFLDYVCVLLDVK